MSIIIKLVVDADNGEPNAYYCVGHVDKAYFMKTLQEMDIQTGNMVRHTYYRCRPKLPHERDEYVCDYWLDETERGHGAYPVTVVML